MRMRFWTCVALLCLACGSGLAEAKPTAAKPAAKPAKKPKTKLNMPTGWTWPPDQQMKDEGRDCLKRLDALGVVWKKAPATPKITTPIYVPSMEFGGIKLTSIWREGPHPMDCFLAEAIAEHAAPFLRSAGVTELRFAGIFDYRNVGGKNILSRHALGLAMDIFEIVTADGQKHIVKDDYKQGDTLLLTVEEWVNQSAGFRLLLTPGNDPAHHYDHFHFEARTPRERPVTTKVFSQTQ